MSEPCFKETGHQPATSEGEQEGIYDDEGGKACHQKRANRCRHIEDHVINELTMHVGQYIRMYDPQADVDTDRNSILATYYHASSNDKNPKHASCSVSANVCCVNQAEATGEEPALYFAKNLYLSRIQLQYLNDILSVYPHLTSRELLQRCLKQLTQNSNESLHSKLWPKCRISKFVSLDRILFALQATRLQHNLGQVEDSLIKSLGLTSEKMFRGLQLQKTSLASPPTKRRRSTTAAGEPSTS